MELIDKQRAQQQSDYDEQKTYLFVLACRHYNRALTRQRYIMHYIDDIRRNNDLFRADRSIENQNRGRSNSARKIMQSIAHDIINRGNTNTELLIKEIRRDLKNAYKDMVSSFHQSRDTLSGVRFSVEYNQDTHTITIPDGDTKTVNKSRKGMISYFTDFLKM